MGRPLSCLAAMLLSFSAHGALPDEIQVYTDDLNAPGEFGAELHVNTTPQGRTAPDYPGELPPRYGWRVTPELSWGLVPTVDAGIYLPVVRDPDGQLSGTGAKVRLKWLPVKRDDGLFLGINGEIARLTPRFSESRWSAELRFIGGWRGSEWLAAVNPILSRPLSQSGSTDLDLAWKLARRIARGIALGGELYSGVGPAGRWLPGNRQDHTLYATVDVDRKPWVFNFGIGRGLTTPADRWTVKAVFDLPL